MLKFTTPPGSASALPVSGVEVLGIHDNNVNLTTLHFKG